LNSDIPSDWYSAKRRNAGMKKNNETVPRFNFYFSLYHWSFCNSCIEIFPEFYWLPWKFKTVPSKFWSKIQNQRLYLTWLSSKFHIQKLEDWYSILPSSIHENNGSGLFIQYSKSPNVCTILSHNYPHHKWLPWKFERCPSGLWRSFEMQRYYVLWLLEKIESVIPEMCYSLSNAHFQQNEGYGLITRYYHNSISSILLTLFPEHSWQLWCFYATPDLFARKQEHLRSFLLFLEDSLQIKRMEDWHRVSVSQISEITKCGFISSLSALYKFLSRFYPSHNWERERETNEVMRIKSDQRWLCICLQKLFPDEEIAENFLHPDLIWPGTKLKMELDIFIPSQGIAFEFQGSQHYSDIPSFFSTGHIVELDSEKRKKCEKIGITLISVPYWWEKSLSSLAATILSHRPDLRLNFPSQ